jgi:hypothetical protein
MSNRTLGTILGVTSGTIFGLCVAAYVTLMALEYNACFREQLRNTHPAAIEAARATCSPLR